MIVVLCEGNTPFKDIENRDLLNTTCEELPNPRKRSTNSNLSVRNINIYNGNKKAVTEQRNGDKNEHFGLRKAGPRVE